MAVPWSRAFDPLETVDGVGGARYHVPDLLCLDAVLRHVAGCRARIDRARFPRAWATAGQDIDRLLDRRAWLVLPTTTREPTCPSRRSSTT